MNRLLLLLVTIALPFSVQAEPEKEAAWSEWTAAMGLQMWRPMYAVDGDAFDKPTIGGVLKLNKTLTDVLGMHLRGSYGVHKSETPNRDGDGQAWAVGAGMDFYVTLSKKAQWSNTFGIGYSQSSIEFGGVDGTDLKSIGGYFVTTFDVTVYGPIGIWMDWGCQIVGPSMGESDAGDISVWHINPMGAGGMRMDF